mmetsp:Transcript_18859/g.58542  ORF Transcript_18859/g.58542 Transcript_18859/m.58542 type:complete len:263 (+) Transcript_18859:1398-2186(+)
MARVLRHVRARVRDGAHWEPWEDVRPPEGARRAERLRPHHREPEAGLVRPIPPAAAVPPPAQHQVRPLLRRPAARAHGGGERGADPPRPGRVPAGAQHQRPAGPVRHGGRGPRRVCPLDGPPDARHSARRARRVSALRVRHPERAARLGAARVLLLHREGILRADQNWDDLLPRVRRVVVHRCAVEQIRRDVPARVLDRRVQLHRASVPPADAAGGRAAAAVRARDVLQHHEHCQAAGPQHMLRRQSAFAGAADARRAGSRP